jgi:hypothetical protein
MLVETLRQAGNKDKVVLIAFPGGTGTANMTLLAIRAGIMTIEIL